MKNSKVNIKQEELKNLNIQTPYLEKSWLLMVSIKSRSE